MITLGILHSHELYQKNLSFHFSIDQNVSITLDTINAQEFIKAIKSSHAPEVVLLDARIAQLQSKPFMNEIWEISRNLKTIILIEEENYQPFALTAFENGIINLAWKDKWDELINAIHIVKNGGYYFPEEIKKLILAHVVHGKDIVCPITLTGTELELLRLICSGLSSRQIGLITHKSHRTIEEYREKLYAKFEVNAMEEFIVKAVKWKLF